MGLTPRWRVKRYANGVANHSAADAIAHGTRTVRPAGYSPLVAMLMLLVLLIPPVWGQDLGELGGVVIAQLPTGDVTWFIGSPSIVILEDGTYLASHDIFIKGEEDPYETRVFRSTDKGQSWTGVSTLTNIMYADLVHQWRIGLHYGPKPRGRCHA